MENKRQIKHLRHRSFAEELAGLDRLKLMRQLSTVVGAQDRVVEIGGREVINFSSNNYLGLANHPALIEAAIGALQRVGVGAGASRLITGSMEDHDRLEKRVAAFHQREAGLLFNSGYHANVGVIPALVGPGDRVFSDLLNHASIIDGCRLSGAEVVVYPHRDLTTLEQALQRPGGDRRLVVTDSVFSMDGDVAPLAELEDLAGRYGALLMVDEAHATGVVGPNGRGLAALAGVHADIHMGTLGKALGSFGAYVVGSVELIQLLVNRARSLVFTTALPPAIAAAGGAAIDLIEGCQGDRLRNQLGARVSQFQQGLEELGLEAACPDLLLRGPVSKPPIFPIIVGDNCKAMEVSDRLLEDGLMVQGIRPPTVPRGTARLRVTLTAGHSKEDVERLLDVLGSLVVNGVLIPPGAINGSEHSESG